MISSERDLKKYFKLKNDKCDSANIRRSKDKHCEFITIRLTFSNLHGEDVIALTNSQLDRLVKADEAKTGMIITVSITLLAYNMKIGGFYQCWLD